jgi:hypothetical protein
VAEALDLLPRLRAWTYRRQLLGRAAPDPAEALRGVVAVYSAHPMGPLALLARSRPFDAVRFAEMEQRRETLRLPGMRGSIFLVPADAAARIFAATSQPLEKHERRLRYAGLDVAAYERLKPRILEHTREPTTPSDLQAALGADASAVLAMRVMAREGLVLRVGSSVRTDRLRYVATDAWLGHPLPQADPAESLAWLAGEYLRAYGPARVVDFAWWSGASRRAAAAALARASVVDVGGGLLLPAEQQAAFQGVEPLAPDAVDVLPKWDPYTMGHAPDGRQRLVDDAHLPLAYTTAGTKVGATAGDGLPLVLRGGRAVAAWSHRFDGKRLRVQVAPFESGALSPAIYDGAFDEVGKLLGFAAVEVTTGETQA